MILHEIGHMLAAMYIGLEPSHISFHPFGVNLKLKNSIACTLIDDIILYLSGPLINLFLAMFFAFIYKPRYLYDYGFAVNILLFTLNMLPVYPLDGGSVLKKILSSFLGDKLAIIIMKFCSFCVAIIVLGVGIFIVYQTGYNYSCIFLSVLLFANLFTGSEKYSATGIKNIIYNDRVFENKTGKSVQLIACTENFIPSNFIKYIRPSVFTCVAVIGEGGKIDRLVTERELIKTMFPEKK